MNVDASLDDFTTFDGKKKTARYRWNFRPRAVQGGTDFTNLFLLVDALHAGQPQPYESQVDALVDVDEWMRTLAVERLVGNWDSYSYSRGKNMYAYKPERGKWNLLAWDIDFVLGLGDPPDTGLFGGQDWVIDSLKSYPPFQRAYWRAFQDAINGPLQAAKVGALLDAKFAGLTANGAGVGNPLAIKTYISQRKTFLQNQINASAAASFTVGTPTINGNTAIFSGTAPVAIKTITFNGKSYPIQWTSVTTWIALVPLQEGVNSFNIVGLDLRNAVVPGATLSRSVTYNTSLPSPVGQVAINEIMANPATPDADYVELYNANSSTTWDLSGWDLNGLAYTFPLGATISPGEYKILAKDRVAFALAYGMNVPVFDTYNGNLQADGETLRLLRPSSNDAPAAVISRVRYNGYSGSSTLPLSTGDPGSSLQLVDPRRDHWRAGNWLVANTNTVVQPQWVYFSTSGTASSSRLYIYLEKAGDLYLDDLVFASGKGTELGPNLVVNGDFESALSPSWTTTPNFANSSVSATVAHSGNSSLHIVATAAGSGSGNTLYQDFAPALTQGAPYSLGFWYLQSTNSGPLVVRLSGAGVTSGSIDPAPPAVGLTALNTPGRANSTASSLPEFPPLWINELQADNLTGVTNRVGQRAPWVELYNGGSNTVDLTGLYLANNTTNLSQWSFPPGTTISPGQFKLVFVDAQIGLSTTNEPHSSFQLSKTSGFLALSRVYNGKVQVLDYVPYSNLAADRSYGSLPDGQSFEREQFYYATPRATNDNAAPPLKVLINEWMADNKSTLQDPADKDFEDWFELYNAGETPADLSGFYLTDTATNHFQFEIPFNGHFVIPPHGFLLVWADGETDQNSTNSPQLHTNFKLDRTGEAIGLFARDGATIDFLEFGPQPTDLSAGRYPDGSDSKHFFAATPGAANAKPNSPPTLDPIPEKAVGLGGTLNFSAHGIDPDQPAQSLTYSLDVTPDIDAWIDPISGLFTWSPSFVGSYGITVVVTDNGVPELSASRSFTVKIVDVPIISGLKIENGKLSFSFSTKSGRQYQLLYSNDLVGWFPMGSPIAGTGSPVALTPPITEATRLFYRVQVLNQ